MSDPRAEGKKTVPPTSETSPKRPKAARKSPARPPEKEPQRDLVEEASDESFPASDPPARTPIVGP